MLTTVNKKIVFAAFALCLGIIAILSSHKLEILQNPHQFEMVKTLSSIQTNDKNKTIDAPIPPVSISNTITIDAGKLKDQITGLSPTALQDRKLQIEQEIESKQLIERYNQHKLSGDETLDLRRLALEKSLITIRLFEIN